MATLSTPEYDIERFTWVPQERVYVIEESDLGPRPYGRVYDDAIDIGFSIRRGSKVCRLVVNHHEYKGKDTEDEELQYIDLIPADLRYQRMDFKVRVYND